MFRLFPRLRGTKLKAPRTLPSRRSAAERSRHRRAPRMFAARKKMVHPAYTLAENQQGGNTAGTDHKRKSFLRNVTGTPYLTAVTVGVSLLFVLALGACIAVLQRSQCPDEPAHAEDEAIRVENVKNSEVLPPCRDGWLGYLDKCYFFSEKEANWDDAKHVCASWNSSLAAIDNQREMDFVMRYKGEIDHWIGLRRDSGQAWKWVNGTEFSNWFIIGDYSECAFLGSFVGSSGCHSKHNWICTSKPFNNEKRTKRVCSFGALIY
ncbi:C-type lectin domain family 2 member D-like isoform X3 [Ambystoma mexicanum]|uniref:C-type lectin domain family 2 member D-like isoform X3 n=1 Tax=Ambystoma mexicanum TaxID=8296 RepID=UPI0037E7769D